MPGKNKDASTINDSEYYKSDDHKFEVSDSSKPVEASKEPITDTHIVHRVRKLQGVSVKPAVTAVGIIGQGGRGITQGMINGGTGIISSNIVTDVLTDSNKMIFKTDTFSINPFKSQTLVIASQDESTLGSNRIVRTSSDIGNSRIYHGRIGTPIVNKKIWSEDDNFRVKIDVDEADKLDTIVQRSPTNKGNTASSQIEEESLESIFSKIVEESNSSERMNLANSLSIEIPKLVHFGHPPIETNNVGNLLDGIVATRIENSNIIWRRTDRYDMMAHTHDVENIS